MTTGVTAGPRATNGSGPRHASDPVMEPATRGRRTRVPELAVGLIVMLGFGLGAVLWQLNVTRKDAVLALQHDVARGEVIEQQDLRVVYVASDDPIAHIPGSQAARILGRVAATDLEAGQLLTTSAVLDGSAVRVGEGVVGLALEPGQLPSSRVRAGDRVNVVAGQPTSAGGEGDAKAGTVIVEGAEVFAVEELTASGRLFVSLKASEADANRIAAAAERGPVRLVWVSR